MATAAPDKTAAALSTLLADIGVDVTDTAAVDSAVTSRLDLHRITMSGS